MKRQLIGLMLLLGISNAVFAHEVPQKARVWIDFPKNGVVVNNPVQVKFAIQGYQVAPAGENVHKAGHYHLLLDLKQDFDRDEPIPRDQYHIH